MRILFSALLFLFLSIPGRVVSQCDPEGLLPSPNCSDAPLICLHDYCASTLNEPILCCNNWCGNNTVINNPQYFAFIPTASCVELEIHVDNCSGGVGLQAAILDACPWDNSNVLDCDPGTPPGGAMDLQACDLMVGQTYWVLIDGSNGSTCHYTFTGLTGIQEDYEISSDLDPLEVFITDSVVCPGYDQLGVGTTQIIADVFGYYWVNWDQDTFTTSAPPYAYFSIPANIPPGTHQICFAGYTGCDTTNEVCISFRVVEPTDQIKESVTLCPEAFPFNWFNLEIDGPGTYVQSFSVGSGCTYDSIWTIFYFPPEEGLLDLAICAGTFTYEGTVYSESGYYDLDYPGQGVNGCDSTAILILDLTGVDAFVSIEYDTSYLLVPHIVHPENLTDTISFEWSWCGTDSLLSTDQNFRTDSIGCICLVIIRGECRDTICSTYSPDGLSICDLGPDLACAGNEVKFTYPDSLPPGASIDWYIDLPDAPDLFFRDTSAISISFNSASIPIPIAVTIRDTNRTWTCHDTIEIQQGPDVTMCCDDIICQPCTDLFISTTSPDSLFATLSNGISELNFNFLSQTQVEVCPEVSILHYFLSVTDAISGCPGIVTGNPVSILVDDLPPPAITQFGNALCVNPNNLFAVEWRKCDSTTILATTACFTPAVSGCYCVEVTDNGGCMNMTCGEFILVGTIALDQEALNIYPIPADNRIFLELTGNDLFPIQWQLVDMYGTIMEKGNSFENYFMIEVREIPPGMYFIQLTSGENEKWSRKIVVN